MDDLTDQSISTLNKLYDKDFLLFSYPKLETEPNMSHVDVIEALADPGSVPSKLDLRTLTLGEQCAYWRAKAEGKIIDETGTSQ